MNMKIDEVFSIWSSFDVDLTPEEMVQALEERGVRVCELSDEHAAMLLARKGSPEEIGLAFGVFAHRHGVYFRQGHLLLRARICDPAVDNIEILEKWIRLFGAIGIHRAVLHCDSASFPMGTSREILIEKNAEMLKKLVPTAEECGVKICLENLIAAFDDAETLNEIIDRVGSDALGICLDTGHLNLTHPRDQEHFIRTAGKRLLALHIADNQGATDQHLMPYGCGTVDIGGVMRGLRAVGYDGLFNYEIPGERRMPLALRKAKTEYLREMTRYFFENL